MAWPSGEYGVDWIITDLKYYSCPPNEYPPCHLEDDDFEEGLFRVDPELGGWFILDPHHGYVIQAPDAYSGDYCARLESTHETSWFEGITQDVVMYYGPHYALGCYVKVPHGRATVTVSAWGTDSEGYIRDIGIVESREVDNASEWTLVLLDIGSNPQLDSRFGTNVEGLTVRLSVSPETIAYFDEIRLGEIRSYDLSLDSVSVSSYPYGELVDELCPNNDFHIKTSGSVSTPTDMGVLLVVKEGGEVLHEEIFTLNPPGGAWYYTIGKRFSMLDRDFTFTVECYRIVEGDTYEFKNSQSFTLGLTPTSVIPVSFTASNSSDREEFLNASLYLDNIRIWPWIVYEFVQPMESVTKSGDVIRCPALPGSHELKAELYKWNFEVGDWDFCDTKTKSFTC